MKRIKSVIVFILGIFSVLYLFNIGAGIFEFIPDNVPFIGNLDEASAVVLLLSCLKYFGLDPFRLFRKDKRKLTD